MVEEDSGIEFNGLQPFAYIETADLPSINSAQELEQQTIAQLADNLWDVPSAPKVSLEGRIADNTRQFHGYPLIEEIRQIRRRERAKTVPQLGRIGIADFIKRHQPPGI